MSIVRTPPSFIDTADMPKARTAKRCTQCDGPIHKNEHYHKFKQNGEQYWCVVCVVKHKKWMHEIQARTMTKWLGANT